MARVYYVGDWAVLTGPVFAETPFYYSHKGLDIFTSRNAEKREDRRLLDAVVSNAS